MADEPLIWWTDQLDCRRIGSGKASWPEYLLKEYRSRLGRNGRGRLWVDKRFGEVSVDPWPETALSDRLAETCAGIVITRDDLPHVAELPGNVTDLVLKLVVPIDVVEEIAKQVSLALLGA